MTWTFAPAGAACLAVALVVVTRGAAGPVGAFSAAPMPTPQPAATANEAPTRVMVLGESVALSMDPGLQEAAPEYNLAIWDRATLGCGFLDVDIEVDAQGNASRSAAERCREWHQTWQADVDAFKPDIVLMAFGAWDSENRVLNSGTLQADTPEWADFVMSGLQKQFDVLTSRGAKLMLATFPYTRPSLWSMLANGDELEQDTRRREAALNDLFREFAAQHPEKVVLVDLNGFASPGGKYTDLYIDGVRMRDDGIHFTEAGALIVARWLAPQIVAAADRSVQ